MIRVTRIKGQVVAINPDLIESVEETPDTHIRLTNGESILIRESLDEVIERVVEFRRFIISAFAVDPVGLTTNAPRKET